MNEAALLNSWLQRNGLDPTALLDFELLEVVPTSLYDALDERLDEQI